VQEELALACVFGDVYVALEGWIVVSANIITNVPHPLFSLPSGWKIQLQHMHWC
jgi:hypothetical protein